MSKKTGKQIKDEKPIRYRCDSSSTPLKVLQSRGWKRFASPKSDTRLQGPAMGPVVVRGERCQARPGHEAQAPAASRPLPELQRAHPEELPLPQPPSLPSVAPEGGQGPGGRVLRRYAHYLRAAQRVQDVRRRAPKATWNHLDRQTRRWITGQGYIPVPAS